MLAIWVSSCPSNKLNTAERAQILNMLVEGRSMRSISRGCDVSFNTIAKLLEDAGEFCARFHDANVRNVKAKRVQCDEVWSFTYANEKNVAKANAAPDGAGDTWPVHKAGSFLLRWEARWGVR